MTANKSYPSELQYIKYLLLRKRHQHCINASLDVLESHKEGADEHPLSKFFASFYLALAHDELARSMHEHSVFKVATFNKAEQHYRQAIGCLPSIEQFRVMLESAPRNGKVTMSESLRLQFLVPQVVLPSAKAQAVDTPTEEDDFDLESDDSFDEILETEVLRASIPSGQLQRDFSSMSLLEVRPKLNKSVSQGLLRPIRPGSPPKAYHLPPKLPYFGKNHSRRPSPFSLQHAPCTTASQPAAPRSMAAREPPPLDLTRLAEHLAGMHTQIQTHISLLQRAKLSTTTAQNDRASRATISAQSPVTRVPKSKSFWSFTPVSVKLVEKQKKIEEGRARGWERKRYRSDKYQVLAEKALAEL